MLTLLSCVARDIAKLMVQSGNSLRDTRCKLTIVNAPKVREIIGLGGGSELLAAWGFPVFYRADG